MLIDHVYRNSNNLSSALKCYSMIEEIPMHFIVIKKILNRIYF